MLRVSSYIAAVLLVACQCAFATTKVSEAKLRADFEAVALEEVVVTLRFPGHFYVQDANNVGLRVVSSRSVAVGSKYTIGGTMGTTSDGERILSATTVTSAGSGTAKPLGMTCASLCGIGYALGASNAGQIGVADGKGPNNVGCYVRLCGKMKTWGVLSDGSADVELLFPSGLSSPVPGSVISVSGISSLVLKRGSYTRALKVADASSLCVVQEADPLYGGEMIYVAAGTFYQGATSNDYDVLPNELPQHEVYLDGYWIGKYEVTRGEYGKFIAAGGYLDSHYWSAEGWYYRNLYNLNKPAWWDESWYWHKRQFQTDQHPVVGISWYEAEAYCNWAGVRLPTEAEWEKAAHWNPGGWATTFPWGNTWDQNKCNNWMDTMWPDDTAPVGTFPQGASYYGCQDMAGNAAEWVHDWMDPTYYWTTPPGGWVNPQGPASSAMQTKVIKGGSWWGDYPGIGRYSGARSGCRNEFLARSNEFPDQWGGKHGFRVAHSE